MYQFKRNQVIIMVLVFMIAIAAYLQFSTNPEDMYAFNQLNNSQEGVVSEIVDTSFLTNLETLPPDGNSSNIEMKEGTLLEPEVVITKGGNQETLPTNSSSVIEISYFAEDKMLREQERSSQIESLTEFIQSDAIDEASKAKAGESLLQIQDRIEKENGTESLLRAKGFDEVFVRIDDNTVNVIVNRAELTDEEIAQIEQIVQSKTNYKLGQIKIHLNKSASTGATN
ncbi:hypothetical protein AN640_04880 [Candidatus Epulonipiscium fishelsonii]|uniref:Uncharacterized protein n=1 Tax=Candidatus Epulonipiscium fishelsonii TaxID=77094 RepID=A0ACC8XIE1_9FIRM|nr:hypothetical protein AN640_04880 [Epulopiscium sp. SCG-D08WGA-EpuloA1]